METKLHISKEVKLMIILEIVQGVYILEVLIG